MVFNGWMEAGGCPKHTSINNTARQGNGYPKRGANLEGKPLHDMECHCALSPDLHTGVCRLMNVPLGTTLTF
jgi:hypothetical protein